MSLLTPVDRRIINALLGGFPLCDRPFAAIADSLDLDEATLIARLGDLLKNGTLTRFGPLFKPEALDGAVTLAALSAPDDCFDTVADIVNGFPEVAHNYARDHALNMWFVVAADNQAALHACLDAIMVATGLPVLSFPKEQEFYLSLALEA